jgi:hypothetical protein
MEKKKILKKNTDYIDLKSFQLAVTNKLNRITFDPDFFADLVDFESGRYINKPRSRRNSAASTDSTRSVDKVEPQGLAAGHTREYNTQTVGRPGFFITR